MLVTQVKMRGVISFKSCWRVYVKVKYLQAFPRNYTPRLINLYRLPPKFRVILHSICRAGSPDPDPIADKLISRSKQFLIRIGLNLYPSKTFQF
jgi:hypothetical protein